MAQKLLTTSVKLLSHKLIPKIPNRGWAASQILVQRRLVNQSVEHTTVKKDESTMLLSEADKKDFFRLNDLFTVEDLFNARVHFGHKERLLHSEMRPYIFGKRLGVLIFDLEITAKLLRQSLNVVAEMAYRDGLILFIHASRQTAYIVERAAKECGEYAHCRRWHNEVLTNASRVFGTVTRLPDLVVFFSVFSTFENTHTGVTMCAKMLIPTVAICDTNSDPSIITYPIPGNDDSPQSIEFYCQLFKAAILKGKAKKEEIIDKYGHEFYIKTLEAV